jgi:hypothetical protein
LSIDEDILLNVEENVPINDELLSNVRPGDGRAERQIPLTGPCDRKNYLGILTRSSKIEEFLIDGLRSILIAVFLGIPVAF